MSAAEWLQANLSVVVFAVVFVLFTLGLVLAMRTAGGRDALAGGAVRLALAFLALAERWIGDQLEPQALAGGVTEYQQSRVTLARVQLTAWLLARSETGQSGKGGAA